MNNEKNQNGGLYIQLYSIHGLIRGNNLELGRDADTGGQTKYLLELAKTLSGDKRVEKVELVTRQIRDKKVSKDYSEPVEKINDKFSIIRIRCGGGKYLRKELLWDYLEEFVDKSIKHIKSTGRLPDVIHSHYADAGYVCTEPAGTCRGTRSRWHRGTLPQSHARVTKSEMGLCYAARSGASPRVSV